MYNVCRDRFRDLEAERETETKNQTQTQTQVDKRDRGGPKGREETTVTAVPLH